MRVFERFNGRKIVFLVFTVMWAAVIFSFSARSGSDSTNESMRAGKLICSIFVPGFNEMSEQRQYEMAGKIDYPVRKMAHATEYAILGCLIAGTLYDARNKRVYNISIPYAAGTIYAATDEIHQYFVPGRSCRFADVAIDSAGVFAGILVSCVIIMLHRKLRGLRR